MGRPPEPYYGREIGTFAEFAHGIKVCSLDPNQFIN